MPQPESIRDAALYLWEGYLNTPYRWAGDDPINGIDCSGLVLAGLQGVGSAPRDKDFTAHDILHVLHRDKPRITDRRGLRRGMLVFWGAPRITHVGIVWAVIGDSVLTIEASGGDRRTVDSATAAAMNAFVQIKPLRDGFVAAVDPFSEHP